MSTQLVSLESFLFGLQTKYILKSQRSCGGLSQSEKILETTMAAPHIAKCKTCGMCGGEGHFESRCWREDYAVHPCGPGGDRSKYRDWEDETPTGPHHDENDLHYSIHI